MKLEDTISGFQEIIDGKHDELPEQAFYMVGAIEERRREGRSSCAAGRRLGLERTWPTRTRSSTSRSSPRTAPAFEGEAEMLIVPGAAGEIGILARHAPLVATLKAGSTRVHLGGNEVLEFATGPGSSRSSRSRARARRRRGRRRTRSTTSARERSSRRRRRSSRVRCGESEADRWQLEQRIRHAENQLAVAGR